MLHALKLLKFLAYVFATSVVVMVLGLFYGLIPIAILDAKSLIPALKIFYQVTGVVGRDRTADGRLLRTEKLYR